MVDFYRQNRFFMPGQVMGAIAPSNQYGTPTLPPGPVAQTAPPPAVPGPGPLPSAAMPLRGAPQPGLDSALQSPYMAMAMQGLNNLAGYRTGRPYRQDPLSAYQDAVAQNSLMDIRRRSDQRSQESHQRSMDPAFDYNSLVEQGLIDPEEVSFEEYTRWNLAGRETSVQRNFETWLMLNPDADLEQKRNAFNAMARAPQDFDLGGGGAGSLDPLTGKLRTVVSPEDATNREANLAGATTAAEQTEMTDAEQVRTGLDDAWAARTAYADATSMLTESEKFLQMLEDGVVDTGPISSMLYNWFGVGSEELAAMNNESIMQTLRNLGITNLAPVTEKEFAEVAKLWADISLQETPNIGSVKHAMRRTERLRERIQADARAAGQRVRTYGGDAAFDQLWESNPFIQELYPRTSTPAPDTGGDDGWGIKPAGG